jgi:TatD DNase family protein
MLVDIHTHLDHYRFKQDLDEVIARAKKAKIKAIITSGVDPKTNRAVLKLAKKYDIVKAALGLYQLDLIMDELEPQEYPTKLPKTDVDAEIEFIRKNKDKIIAISEVGLDNYWVKGKLKEQTELFQKMISLAEQLKKPIVVHSRKAEKECIDLLESSKLKKIVMHCFGGNLKQTRRIEENGWSISIPTSVVRSTHFQKIVEKVSIGQIFTETDAPYLAPEKGQRNEPAFIAQAVKKIAEIKKMDVKEVENNIFMNYQRMF